MKSIIEFLGYILVGWVVSLAVAAPILYALDRLGFVL